MQIGKMVKVYVWHLVPYTSTEGMRRSWSQVGDNVSSITFVYVIIIIISFIHFVFIVKLVPRWGKVSLITLPIIFIVICYYHISFIHIACIHFEADLT